MLVQILATPAMAKAYPSVWGDLSIEAFELEETL
jgi:hypothetical protein